MGFLCFSVRKETSQVKPGLGQGQNSACFTADTLYPIFQPVPKKQTAGNELGKATSLTSYYTIKGVKVKIT